MVALNEEMTEESGLIKIEHENLKALITPEGRFTPEGQLLEALITPEGQLVSIKLNQVEYMHGGGKPEHLKLPEDKKGFPKSESTFFSIIGAPKTEGNGVVMNGKEYVLDEHGLAKARPFEITHILDDLVLMTQTHNGKLVKNLKSDSDGNVPEFINLASYSMQKEIAIPDANTIVMKTIIKNQNQSESVNFRYGGSLAFKVKGEIKNSRFHIYGARNSLNGIVTMEEVIEKSVNGAVKMSDVSKVTYFSQDTRSGINFFMKGLYHVVLRAPTEDAGVFCIEPVTNLPKSEGIYLEGVECITLPPNKSAYCSVCVQPFTSELFVKEKI
ncbi:MAG: hypothetical protein ACP5N2_04465 [Candidatus Nanoarchaeia archaeon]